MTYIGCNGLYASLYVQLISLSPHYRCFLLSISASAHKTIQSLT